MEAVSEHSTMKVDSPAIMRSDAPSLVKILSATDKRQEVAGTQQPIWARTTARQVALSSVLLPPMLGPVSRRALACLYGKQNQLIRWQVFTQHDGVLPVATVQKPKVKGLKEWLMHVCIATCETANSRPGLLMLTMNGRPFREGAERSQFRTFAEQVTQSREHCCASMLSLS